MKTEGAFLAGLRVKSCRKCEAGGDLAPSGRQTPKNGIPLRKRVSLFPPCLPPTCTVDGNAYTRPLARVPTQVAGTAPPTRLYNAGIKKILAETLNNVVLQLLCVPN